MKLGHKDFDIYKRILIIVHDKVMPNLSRYSLNSISPMAGAQPHTFSQTFSKRSFQILGLRLI